MELKTARLTLLIDPDKKAAFERLCAQQDRTASQVVRQLIRDYLAQHGVQYAAERRPGEPADVAAARTRPSPKRTAPATAQRGLRRR
jgi:predicted transcriptional regulator